MDKILNILNSFQPISLKEMDNVKLMNRTDRKFCFHITQLPEVLNKLNSSYRVLQVETKRISRYKSLYYDTIDFSLYNMHHSGKLNRYKVRHRTYTESEQGYLEVKFKNNKERTIKSRIKNKEVPMQWQENTSAFLERKTPFEVQTLLPTIWVNYSRITLVSIDKPERLTIDINLEFVSENNNSTNQNLVIAEVKQDRKTSSAFIEVAKKMKLQEGSISKYCMAVATTFKHVKKNNFKQKIKTILNISYDTKYIVTGS